MATTTTFLSTAIASIPSRTSSSSSSIVCLNIDIINVKKSSELTICKATKRSLSISLLTGLSLALVSDNIGVKPSNAAILEADDDEELMEKVKQDRKKRLERQGVLNSSNKETGYLQEVVYKLSKVGQAIDNNDLSSASTVLGENTDSDWVKNANSAFSKLSSSPEEKSRVDTFNSSLSSLISSVTKNDVESSKTAFLASATALEEWSNLTGLVSQLKGL